MNIPIVSLVTFLPLLGAVLFLFVRREQATLIRFLALGITLVNFLLSVILFFRFESGISAPQFMEKAQWLGFGLDYHVGVDGISMLLVLLTNFLMPIIILSSWNAVEKKVKEYHMFMLLLQCGIIGVFVSLNLFLFYIFWEAMLIPMYFLIGIWGGKRRIYATVKFVIFTMFGSLLMLVAIIFLYSLYYKATGVFTLNIFDFYSMVLPPGIQTWLFLAFGLAFAIKVPMFPFHTWLPDAHVEAPTAGSVILAGVLLKMGTYGFLRFGLPLFPEAAEKFIPLLMILSVVGIIYGALMALIQKDVKSLVAYSSVSHMGLIMLAVFAVNMDSLQGAVYQMLNHGLSTGALFLCVGILYQRAHTRLIKDYGGVSRQMPVFAAVFLICILSSVGLPGLNGFVGEVLCLFGIFQTSRIMAILGVTTIILGAAYLLWMFQRVMQGPVTQDKIKKFPDLSPREIGYFIPILILIFLMGIYPRPFLKKMEASVDFIIEQVQNHQSVFAQEKFPEKTGIPLIHTTDISKAHE